MQVRLPRDLKIRLGAIVLLASMLTMPGLYYLYWQSAKAVEQAREVAVARADQVASEVQAIADDAALDAEGRRLALESLAVPGVETAPIGNFSWLPRKGLVWTNSVPGEVARTLAGRMFLKDWVEPGRGSAKRPPRRGDFTVETGAGAWRVFWARGTVVEPQIYGVVYGGDPIEGGGTLSLWPVAGVLLLLFLVVLAGVAWMLAHEVAKAREEDRQKTSFMSNVSHELKTPLAAIGTWSWMLQQGRLSDPEKIRYAHDMIVEENARMVRMVEGLLEFSRLERGTRKYRFEVVDVARLAETVVELMRGNFSGHGIELKAGGECLVPTDADAVKQILINLLGNAAKYAAEGGKVEVEVTKDGGDRVRVMVSDRGPGLTADEMARVFDRFYRADSRLTTSIGGLGIGLSISRTLAHDLHGDLTVASRPGGGCVFTLTLNSQSHLPM